MSNWKKYKLGDVAQIIGGGTPSTTKEEYWNGEIGWLTPRDLTGYSFKYISKGERNITEEGLKNSSARLMPEGTVLMTSRAPIGYLAIAGDELCTNQGFKSFIVNEDKINNEYLYYLLKSNIDRIKSLGTGSTFAEVSASILKSFEIEIPDLPTQKEIALLLSSLDDKIELNLQMNQTLEAMAQAIFKEWFVNFNFPGFDGELVDGLPKGWSIGNLGELCSNIRVSYNPIKDVIDTRYIGLEHIPRKSIMLSEWGHSDDINSQKSQFQKGDILFGKLRPYFHKVVIAPFNGICSTDILVIRSIIPHFQLFAYFHLFSDECISYSNSHSDGTRMPRVSWNSLSKFQIPIPSDEILIQFQETIQPFFEKVYSSIFENQSLIQTRDTLLPKLMSGNIAVINA